MTDSEWFDEWVKENTSVMPAEEKPEPLPVTELKTDEQPEEDEEPEEVQLVKTRRRRLLPYPLGRSPLALGIPEQRR